MIRQPAVAGSFYPQQKEELSRLLASLLHSEQNPQQARGLIVPHAGYIYSGAVAGELLAQTKIPPTVLMFGPNHYGLGDDVACSAADGWETPLGTVPIASDLRRELCARIPQIRQDERAHLQEHSLEVMLPLLQKLTTELQVVPIALRSLSLNDCLQLGSAVAAVLQDWEEDVLLLASSDMNHFLDAEQTQQLDQLAIDAMTAFDPEHLFAAVTENHISMCGVLPAIVVLQAAKQLGAKECRLVRYAHSGQINGDNSRVVGYAGLTIN